MVESHHLPESSATGEYNTFGPAIWEVFEAAISEGKLADALSTITTKPRESFPDILPRIAVVGVPGSGKTSFINAMQSPHLDGSGAAATDIARTAEVPNRTLAEPARVKFSELTWLEKLLWAEDTHGKEADLYYFDYFVIIAPQNSLALYSHLVLEIGKMDCDFHMVQTKIDLHLEEAKKQQPSACDEKIILSIKNSCKDYLRNLGVKNPQVSVVSNKEPNRFDCPSLQENLRSDHLWNRAMVRKIDNSSSSPLEKKAAQLQRKIWLPIISSGVIAAIPVPGVAFLEGIVLFVTFVSWCCRKFGVDNQSLSDIAKDIEGLLSKLKSKMTSQSKKPMILHRMPDFLGALLMTAEYLYWEQFPIFGCVLSGGVSLVSSYFMLKKSLSDVKKDTQNVLNESAAAKLEKKTNH